MGIRIRRDGATLAATGMKVKVAGLLRTIRTVKAMSGGTLRTVASFAPPMRASASPASVAGHATSKHTQTVATGPTVVTPLGGSPPYSYAWSILEATGGGFPAFSNAASATTVIYASMATDTQIEGAARCTVTDAIGQTAAADATFHLQHDFG